MTESCTEKRQVESTSPSFAIIGDEFHVSVSEC